MIELRHSDVRHFGIEACSHLVHGCISKCGVICDINIIEFVSVHACRVYDVFVASCATAH